MSTTVVRRGRTSPRHTAAAIAFLAPAVVVLGALVVYPVVATFVFSLKDATGTEFVGLANYREMLTNPRILVAIRNNAIWVLVVPPVVTAIGLVFAVATERVPFSTAFKTVVFMPMAISLVAGGVIWRIVYEEDPDRGVVNAAIRAGDSVISRPGPYAGAAPSQGVTGRGRQMVSATDVRPGETVSMGLLRLPESQVPDDAEPAARPQAGRVDRVAGVVFRDFAPGGGGTRGRVDAGELGLPGVVVDLRDATGRIVGSAVTDARGRFEIADVPPGRYRVVLPVGNFRAPFGGIGWLGPALVTPAVIAAYTWMWAGFAMVVIASGLAAIPREVLEAARVDGANAWQTFRFVTVPLLAPVLLVVVITMVIYVLKVFDIVLVLAPPNAQDDANVIALEMWQTAFGARNLGLGSAVAVLLLALVVPFMVVNIRRLRREQA